MSAVSMLRRPGSTPPATVYRPGSCPPRCSMRFHTITTTSSRARTIWVIRALSSVLSGQMHPAPPFLTPPRRINLIWSSLADNFFRQVVHLGFNLKKRRCCRALLRFFRNQIFHFAMGTILSASGFPGGRQVGVRIGINGQDVLALGV